MSIVCFLLFLIGQFFIYWLGCKLFDYICLKEYGIPYLFEGHLFLGAFIFFFTLFLLKSLL